jgi:hypothetical protein
MVQDIFNFKYSGKPSGSLALPKGKYTTVDVDTPDPVKDGLEFKLIYVNLAIQWSGVGVGNIRVKFTREGGDDTAYQDYAVNSQQDSFLITHMHMEMGEEGVGGRWKIKPTGDMKSVTATTRYSKYATIKDKG